METKTLFNHAVTAENYKKFRPHPPEELVSGIVSYIKEKYPGPLKLAVDVGCGSGQCTELLAPHFERIIGCDTSKEQIQKAIHHCKQPNSITYCVASAEKLPLPHAASAQLVIAVTAAHWFSLDSFFEEVQRILVPGGVVAIVGYAAGPTITCGDVSEELQKESAEFIATVYRPFYEKCADKVGLIINEYKDIKMPFSETSSFREEPWLVVNKTGTLEDLVGHKASYSAWLDIVRNEGQEKADQIMEDFRNRCRKIIGDDADSKEMTLSFRYFAVMSRKPL